MAELVIHIGDCKAGSTSIQRVLDAGGWQARGGAPLAYAAAARRNAAHHLLADAVFMDRKRARAPAVYAALASELAACPAQRLVISSERFEFADPAALRALIDRHMPAALPDLRLIAYVRPHAERVVSGYAQRTKQGKIDLSLEAFHDKTLRRGGFMFAPRLSRWQEVFGPRLTVRPMIRDRLLKRCVVHDFVGWAAGTDDVSLAVPAEANSSVTLEDLAIIRLIRQAAPRPRQVQALCRRLAELMEATPPAGGTRLKLHRSLAERIARDYAEDAAAVDARFFGGAPILATALQDAVARALPAPQELSPEALLPPELLRAGRMLAQLIGEAAAPGKGRMRLARAGADDED